MFEVFGTTFRITYVSQIFLWLVAKQWYQDEGCKSPEEFEQVWKALHPRRGFDPNQKVWLHRFVRVYDGIMVEQYVKLKGGP